MRTFELHRITDVSGISGVGIVAQGFEFDDGTCVLRWTTAHRSTAIYSSSEELEAIHGHAGATRVNWTSDVYRRARTDCIQDGCENCPFASIGGLEKRGAMVCPDYISRGDEKEYLRGYRETALLQYGPDWETCSFGWGPAITINEPAGTPSKAECGVYLGDNDGTCPQLTCIRDKGHDGAHDNVCGDGEGGPVAPEAGPSSWPVRGEAIRLFIKHQWIPHDETRDYCIECGGTKPDPGDHLPMGHVKGCAVAALLVAAGVEGILESGLTKGPAR